MLLNVTSFKQDGLKHTSSWEIKYELNTNYKGGFSLDLEGKGAEKQSLWLSTCALLIPRATAIRGIYAFEILHNKLSF